MQRPGSCSSLRTKTHNNFLSEYKRSCFYLQANKTDFASSVFCFIIDFSSRRRLEEPRGSFSVIPPPLSYLGQMFLKCKQKFFRTRCAGLSISLQVDPGGTGTAGGFGSRRQETEVAAASIIHRTRVTHYTWRHKHAQPPSYFLGQLGGKERQGER